MDNSTALNSYQNPLVYCVKPIEPGTDYSNQEAALKHFIRTPEGIKFMQLYPEFLDSFRLFNIELPARLEQ